MTQAHRRQEPVPSPRSSTPWLAAILCLLGVVVGLTRPADAQVDESRYEADLRALAAFPSRAVGASGYYAAADYLEAELKQLEQTSGVQWQRHEYPVMVPVTRSATLEMAGRGAERVYPFWPAHIRLNATPSEGIRGRLVYCGDGDFEQLRPADLAGQIAVVECTPKGNWRNAAYFGAKAVLVLGKPETIIPELRSHELIVTVNFPRFYVPPGRLNDALRAGQVEGEALLKASADWQRVTARNYYAVVKGKTRIPKGWKEGEQPPAALAFSVPFDASSLVPDLAPGATQAAQTAAGLALLRDFAAKPVDRPVMVCFGGADSIQFRATREMFLALSDVPGMWRPELAELSSAESDARRDLERLLALKDVPERLDIVRDRNLINRIGKIVETDLAIDQDELFRIRRALPEQRTPEAKAREEQIVARQSVLNRLKYALDQAPAKLVGDLAAPAREYVDKTLRERLQGDPSINRDGLVADLAARRRLLERRIALYEWLAGVLGRNKSPSAKDNDSRLIELLVAIDLSDRGVRVGPMHWGAFQQSSSISQIQNFRDWFNRAERFAAEGKPEGAWLAPHRGILDFDPLSGSRSPQSWLANPMPIGSELGPAWGTPGLTMMTLDDPRLRRDTPNDTLENFEVRNVFPQLRAVAATFREAWNDVRFKGDPLLSWMRSGFSGQVVSPAPGRPVPDLPRPGFLATYYYVEDATTKNPKHRWQPYSLGVRRVEVRDCDAEGNYRFEGLPKLHDFYQMFMPQVYQLAPGTGEVVAITDAGRQSADLRRHADIKQPVDPLKSVVFSCQEFSLVGLHDPRFLQTLGECILLDARRNAEPQRFNFSIYDELMAGYVEPDAISYLVFRYGRVGNRLLLINMADSGNGESAAGEAKREARAEGDGFSVAQLNNLGPLSLATSKDFWRLDDLRLRKYAAAGVSSSLVDSLHRSAADQIALAENYLRQNRGPDTVREANGAWANNARVYAAAEEMARDVVRGAIFLLLLCVPFAFCMERLLVGTPSVYKQIAWVFVIFGLMTAALWSFHPAFKISSSPLIIVLAFAIIFMSLTVIFVVYGKFDTELKRIRSGRGTAQATSFARASVLMSAVLLGIANMRKRKFRTALTSITVVLITFAVLCFTSASRYVGTTTLPTGVTARFPGILLRQRGYRAMPNVVASNLRSLLPGRTIVERYWNINPWDTKDQLHLVARDPGAPESQPRIFATQAILGISPGESELSRIGEVLGPDYQRLEKGEPADQNIIYISSAVAEQLKVAKGDRVQLGGLPLEVAGIFDAEQFDQKVVMLSGDPLAPLKYSPGALDSGGRQLTDNAAESLSLDADSTANEAGSTYEHLSSSQFVIVPANISRLLPNSSLRSVSFKTEDPAEVRLLGRKMTELASQLAQEPRPQRLADELETAAATLSSRADARRVRATLADLMARLPGDERLADDLRAFGEDLLRFDPVREVSEELSKRLALAMFAGFDEGVKMVAASNLSSVSGAGAVAVPLAIAGLIIFNTMMGSIAERRREIHVYTSLGLAPMHVGALFVAEALTYGLIGAVFGYIIGQGVGTAMLKLGWLGNVTLNYSGSSAILTMGLILLIVLLSALVPARLASKIAAPSIERTWKVPLPHGDEIIAHLPFTINKTAADGALAYLAEYFDAHREGSIGKFSAGKVDFVDFEIPAADDGRPGVAAADAAHEGAARLADAPATSRGLKTVIWLTPFDLGVRQHLILLIHPGQYQDIYEVQVILQRLSGDDGSWYRMNRTFLTELRKQFLQWRSLSQQRMLEYVEESKRLFAGSAPQHVVTTTAGEDVRLG